MRHERKEHKFENIKNKNIQHKHMKLRKLEK